jgi:2-haloacid dehalogenase
MPVRACIFDIGGTVFDWNTPVVDACIKAAGVDGHHAREFALCCRAGFLDRIGAIATGALPFATSDVVLRDAVSDAARHLESGLSPSDIDAVALSWRSMPAWPGARESIAELRLRRWVAPLTILSWPVAVGSSRGAGIVWDGLLCCDVIGVYKPDPACYRKAADIMRLDPGEIMMVASHPSDLRAAAACGWKTAYVVARLEDPGDDYTDTGFLDEFDIVARDFAVLAERLA